MKLTAILLTVACIGATASGRGQRVTLNEHQVPVEKVFKEIRKQTGLNFLFSSEELQKAKLVTIQVTNATVEEALARCLAGQPFHFTIEGNTIVVKQKPAVMDNPIEPSIAVIDIHGRIANENGDPVEGASVKIKGTDMGTTTDEKGEFILKEADANTILVITGINIEPIEKKVNGKTTLMLKAKTKVTSIPEVVVNKGYYSVKQRENTGNVSVVTSKDLEKQPVTDPLLALEGRVPGLYIAQTSGIPGSQVQTIRLRGQNSIPIGKPLSANDPLFIVDGVPYNSETLSNVFSTGQPPTINLSPFNNLNMADIENVEVLKDADATAIYGSRGANGVILITTKKGKPGKTNVEANISSSFGRSAHKINFLNTKQYLKMRHEAFYNDSIADPLAGITPGFSDYDINGTWDTTAYTDWQDIFLGKTSNLTNAQASVSGGNANTQFLFSAGYTRQTEISPGDYADRKASIHLNVNHSSLNNKFTLQASASYVNDNNLLPAGDLAAFIALAPNAPALYKADGTLNWANGTWGNPLALLNIKAHNITDNLISNLQVGYKILKELQISISGSYNNTEIDQSTITPGTAFNPAFASFINFVRSNYFATNKVKNWIVEPQLNYSKRFGVHKIDFLLGATFSELKQDGLSQTATNFSSDALIPNVKAAANTNIEGFISTLYHYSAIFGRASYNYNEKYFVNLTARRDGSSRFGPGKQFGNFGAIGAGWIFSEERFFKNLPFISFGKLRASYGITGNDKIPDYQFLSTYVPYPYNFQGINGLYPTRIPNADYAWEEVRKLEGGLDLGFLKDRIFTTISYYRNRTDNSLVTINLPTSISLNTDGVQGNLPALVQNTGWEITVNSINIKTNDFSWNTGFNISFPKNKLVSFPGLENSSYQNYYVIGQPLNIIRAFHSTGIDPQTGVYQFDTKNANGIPTYIKDYSRIAFRGQQYFGMLTNNLRFKNIQLSADFYFVKQTGINPLFAFPNPGGTSGYSFNQPIEVLNRWQKPGDITDIQRASQAGDGLIRYDYASKSDLNIMDASFIRLKNAMLSYDIPIRKGIRKLNVYVLGQNLLTFTKYKILDPETQNVFTPPIRTISIGAKISL